MVFHWNFKFYYWFFDSNELVTNFSTPVELLHPILYSNQNMVFFRLRKFCEKLLRRINMSMFQAKLFAFCAGLFFIGAPALAQDFNCPLLAVNPTNPDLIGPIVGKPECYVDPGVIEVARSLLLRPEYKGEAYLNQNSNIVTFTKVFLTGVTGCVGQSANKQCLNKQRSYYFVGRTLNVQADGVEFSTDLSRAVESASAGGFCQFMGFRRHFDLTSVLVESREPKKGREACVEAVRLRYMPHQEGHGINHYIGSKPKPVCNSYKKDEQGQVVMSYPRSTVINTVSCKMF